MLGGKYFHLIMVEITSPSLTLMKIFIDFRCNHSLLRNDSMFKKGLQGKYSGCQTKRDKCNLSIIDYFEFARSRGYK
jgi:hypothetical protein